MKKTFRKNLRKSEMFTERIKWVGKADIPERLMTAYRASGNMGKPLGPLQHVASS